MKTGSVFWMERKMKDKYLAVVGSRTVNESRYSEFETFIAKALKVFECNAIVSGGAKGADRLAEIYADRHAIPIKVLHADWRKYGKPAGMIRNSEIVKTCSALLAFWDGSSRGTQDSCLKCRKLRKPYVVISTKDRSVIVGHANFPIKM